MPRALIALALSLATAPVSAQSLHRYEVSIDEALDGLTVRACFDAAPPSRLVAASGGARGYLRDVRIVSGEGSVGTGRAGIDLTSATAGTCLAYRVDVAAAVADRRRGMRRVGADLLTSPTLWLWRAPQLDAGEAIEVEFALPAGLAVSTPWLAIGPGRYRVGRTPHDWPARIAFGRFVVDEVSVPGATLRLAVLDGRPEASRAAMREWLTEAAAAVTTLYGRFPVSSPQLLVVPQGRGGEPVPWGQVMRGGQPAAHFVVDQRRPLSEFRADWTAAHELSHMLLPYVSRDDAWLSEGFASYYQNVLRARAGMIDERLAWQKLHEGFQRGTRGMRGTLSEAARDMYRRNAFMQVYWSGAAIALLADIELRRRTGGRHSLDTALAGLQRCCVPGERMWSAEALSARLDELTGTTVFAELLAAHADSAAFPDVAPAYAALGLELRSDRVHLDEDAEGAPLRRAIAGRRTGAAAGAP